MAATIYPPSGDKSTDPGSTRPATGRAWVSAGQYRGSDNNPHYRDDGHQTPITSAYLYTPKVLTILRHLQKVSKKGQGEGEAATCFAKPAGA